MGSCAGVLQVAISWLCQSNYPFATPSRKITKPSTEFTRVRELGPIRSGFLSLLRAPDKKDWRGSAKERFPWWPARAPMWWGITLYVYPEPRRRHLGHFGMAVRDDWQGQGVGTTLMESALDLADN